MVERETLLFDLYGTLVDPIAIATELEEALRDGQGREVAQLWRRTQLEYSFRLTVMGRYEDFRWVTTRALDYSLAAVGVALDLEHRARLIDRYDRLRPFDDAAGGLQALTDAGHALGVLSNGTPEMIENCVANSGLGGYFTQLLSVDAVAAYKPSPRAYDHAATALGVPIETLRLVSCNAFDVVGANAAGMRTAWVNRSGAVFDTIGEPPDVIVASLAELPAAIGDPH